VLGWRIHRGVSSGYWHNPGHWVAFAMGCYSGLGLVATLGLNLSTKIVTNDGVFSNVVAVGISYIVALVPILIDALATRRFWNDSLWRAFFVSDMSLLASGIIWSLVGYPEHATDELLVRLPDYITMMCLSLLFAAIGRDFFYKVRRDWIHFAGVAAYLLLALQRVLWNYFASYIT
jgi:hypothetical protein